MLHEETHRYLSTACLHGECGECRKDCKFCTAPCEHECHAGPEEEKVLEEVRNWELHTELASERQLCASS